MLRHLLIATAGAAALGTAAVHTTEATAPPSPARPAAAAPAQSPPVPPAPAQRLRLAPFGDLTVYRRKPEPDRFVLFLSGDGGWNRGVVDMASQLADMDATVVGIDTPRYLKTAQAGAAPAIYAAGDLETLSHYVQKALGFRQYHQPAVVGYSSGATVAYAALVQAPRNTFRGAIGLGFCPDLRTGRPFAAGEGHLAARPDKALGWVYSPSKTLSAPFIALQGLQDKACPADATHAFLAQTNAGRVIDLPKVGHGYSTPANWVAQFRQAFDSLAPAAASGARPATDPSAALGDLPLVAQPANGGSPAGRKLMAVFYSGDGGWAGIDQSLAAQLTARGVPVVGVDSLRYFWNGRTPQQAADDLAGVLRTYMARWGRSDVILIGYSFGADPLPLLWQRLTPDLRAHVRQVVLIGPSGRAEFQFHLADWLDRGASDTVPITPALQAMRGTPVLCVYGADERSPACPQLPSDLVHAVRLEGGHHFNGAYQSVGDAIAKTLGL